MADEEKVQAEKAETKKPEPPPPTFKITNIVRRQQSRVRRVVAPGKRRFKQYVCGRRLLRGQSMRVSPEEMEKYRDRLYEQVREGAIEIEAPDGSRLYADHLGNLVARKGMEVQVVDQAKIPAYSASTKKGIEPEKAGPNKTVLEEKKPDLPPPPPPTSPPPPPTTADDLTELPGVGAGRAKKLEAAGITTFKQLAEMSPEQLSSLLGLTEDAAADICNAASEKEEG
jgi:predicted flap endonuclease-1-like 5' DNA nuclease